MIVSHDPGLARHVDRVVAIRDGKTASETVRQTVPAAGATGDADQPAEQEEFFEELVVLDSAGRLQVPKEYLEHFNIKGRARLELTEEGILIRPAPEFVQTPAAETPVAELIPSPKERGLRGLLSRWRRDGGRRRTQR